MKNLIIFLAFISLPQFMHAQILNDTIFYFKNGRFSGADSADYRIEVRKNNQSSYLINYYKKNESNEWSQEDQSKIYTIKSKAVLKEVNYKKKKIVSSNEIEVKKCGKSMYQFKEGKAFEYFSKFPVPVIKDSIQTVFYPEGKQKMLECDFSNNIMPLYKHYNRNGELLETDVCTNADVEPKYNGKDLEYFREVVQREMIYPPIAVENGIYGRVIVQFIVRSDGSLGNVSILRGVDSSLDNECIRAIKATKPLWSPGYVQGKPVSVLFVMPLIFQLQ